MEWTKGAECTITIVTWWQDCNTTIWIQSNQLKLRRGFLAIHDNIYKRHTQNYRTITTKVVILLKIKRHFKMCYIQKKNDMRMMCLNEKKVPFSKLKSMWILLHEIEKINLSFIVSCSFKKIVPNTARIGSITF